MPTIPIKSNKKQQKIIWGVSLFLGWVCVFFLKLESQSAVYGSFLLWAGAAGMIWAGSAPFLAVGIFIVGSVSLSWEVLSTDPWRWFHDGTALWALVVFFSSLSCSFGVRLQREQKRTRNLERGLVKQARFELSGRMCMSMGHELRNQIAIVTGYLDQMKYDELVPPHQRKIERSLLANEKMLKLLAQLHFMTREADTGPLVPLKLSDLLQDALEFVERPLQYRSIQITWNAPSDLPRVMAHPFLLHMLLVQAFLHSLELFRGSTASQRKGICIDITRQGEGLRLHYYDNSQDSRLWDEASVTVVENLILRQGGYLQQHCRIPAGWEVIVYLKSETQDTGVAS